MKKHIAVLTTALILSATMSLPASAEEVDANDPCAVVLCMYGKVTGSADSNCNGPIRKFFSLKVFKKGIFQPWKTLDVRRGLLGQCKAADPDVISKILGKFGRSR